MATTGIRPVEMCCNCDRPTGNAGKDEDSLYLRDATGEMRGPYCAECFLVALSANHEEANQMKVQLVSNDGSIVVSEPHVPDFPNDPQVILYEDQTAQRGKIRAFVKNFSFGAGPVQYVEQRAFYVGESKTLELARA